MLRSLGPLVSVLVAVLSVVTGEGCGRSAEPRFACPAPPADCEELRETQQAVERIYTIAAVDEDGALMNEAAQCTQIFVDAAIDQGCVDRCDELCRLHPCAVVDDEGNRFDPATCPARCAALVQSGDIDDDALDTATFKAAENPGFCTCRACTAADDALCTRLFDCALDDG